MGFLGGITNAINPASLAMTAALGPAGFLGKTLVSAIGQQILQQLGEKMGLPQSTIDMAQGAFAAGMGDFRGAASNVSEAMGGIADQLGASPVETGSATSQLNDAIDQLTSNLAQSREAKEARNGGGKSWLMVIAEALGRTADRMANEMDQMSQGLGKGSSQASDNLKFAAKSQEFNNFFQSANTVIKTIGEALGAASRKQ